MRGDLATWVPEEMMALAMILEEHEEMAAKLHETPNPEVGRMKRSVHAYLSGRAAGRVDATTLPPFGKAHHTVDEQRLLTSEEAAKMLGCTDGAVRKAARTGRFCGVAHKVRGQWMIPAVVVEAEAV